MKYPIWVTDSQRLENFLTSNDPYDLDAGMFWYRTPQGEQYWELIFRTLCKKNTPRNLEQAKNYIRGFLGIKSKIFEEEAEWE